MRADCLLLQGFIYYVFNNPTLTGFIIMYASLTLVLFVLMFCSNNMYSTDNCNMMMMNSAPPSQHDTHLWLFPSVYSTFLETYYVTGICQCYTVI